MTKLRRACRNLFVFISLVAGVGFAIPGSPPYLPSLLSHYSHYQAGHSLGYWLRFLHNSDPQIRLQAITALGHFGSDAAEAVPDLVRILTEDGDEEARQQAALALAKLAPASAAAVPALARALEDDAVPLVRMDAAIALLRLGPLARAATPALIRAMQRRANRTNLGKFSLTIQEMAIVALGRATAGTADGVAALIEALRGARTASKRRLVARALAEIGTPARAAEPLLRPLLSDDSPEVREAAKQALDQISKD